MRIDSSGNVNIKTGNLSIGQSSENNISNTTGETWIGSNGLRYNSGSDTFARSSATAQAAMMVLTTTADVEFYTQPSTSDTGTYALTPKMVIKGNGNVGIGTDTITNPYSQTPFTDLNIDGTWGGVISFKLGGTEKGWIGQRSSGNADMALGASSGQNLLFYTDGTNERMRITSGGTVFIDKDTAGIANDGIELKPFGQSNFTCTGGEGINVNRKGSDGNLMRFYNDSVEAGTISVSGGTVSYNGFAGCHESSGINSDVAIGTVVSTIDELDTRVVDEEIEDIKDHAKIKISDEIGDKRVYGVLQTYSEENDKPKIASVGIGSILVTGSCEGGDLLVSNGDGTAKVQDDDIVRSKTIGKVTIGNTDTEVKLVSCVLYCG
jgi:hypothetical protein